ncbi:hypothetical protein AAFF_G00093230 [Aldrovandia affinis]|uniref:Uncharacterized protein n=1 Tax=Aldrovandia affinis TaxID=143900 RepID=A0AAD7T2R7_9TELE|nr:hypothetical protein AAFF_G00093230 [Aldrovandia affinis]
MTFLAQCCSHHFPRPSAACGPGAEGTAAGTCTPLQRTSDRASAPMHLSAHQLGTCGGAAGADGTGPSARPGRARASARDRGPK